MGWMQDGRISMTVYEIASEKTLAMTSWDPRNDKRVPLQWQAEDPALTSRDPHNEKKNLGLFML